MSSYVKEQSAQTIHANGGTQRGIFAAFANHPTAPNLIMILMVMLGLWAIGRIPVQFFPDTEVNFAGIIVRWAGASPTDVDESILEVILPELEALEDVDNVSSIASEGVGSITVEFVEDSDAEAVIADITTTLDGIALPDDADDPVIRQFGFRDSVARILVSAPLDRRNLIKVAEDIQSGLLDAGVVEVNVTGAQTPLIEVEPDEAKLRQLNITIQDINNLLASRSTNAPAGSLGDGGTLVRSIGRAVTVEDIRDLPVFTRSNGTSVLLGEVAEVRNIVPDTGREIRRKFNPGIELVVNRGAGANALKVNDLVQGYVMGVSGQDKPITGVVTLFGAEFQLPFLRNQELENAWERGRQDLVPASVRVETYAVRADIIKARLNLLIENGALGLVIVLILLAVFLNLRTAFWVAVGIPVSFAATLAVMYLTGQSINMISTFGLLITLGIIVDDAIVVGEHADQLAGGGVKIGKDAKDQPIYRLGAILFTLALALTLVVGLLGGIPGTENIGQGGNGDNGDNGGLLAPVWGALGAVAGNLKSAFGWLLTIGIVSMLGAAILIGGVLMRTATPNKGDGVKPRIAAVLAAQRMAAPVSAAAITTLLAFAAMILIGGTFSNIVTAIPLAVLAVLIASLIECFFVLPGHMRHALESRAKDQNFFLTAPIRWFRLGFDTLFDGFRFGLFRKAVRAVVFLRYPMIGLSIVLFAWSLAQVSNGNIRFTFFRGPSTGAVNINYELVEGSSRDDNRQVIDDVQRAAETAFNGLDSALAFDKAVNMVVGRVGDQVQRRGGGSTATVDPNTVGSVSIYLTEEFLDELDVLTKNLPPPASFLGATGYFQRQVQNAMPQNPKLANFAARSGRFSPGGEDVDIRILNAEPGVMKGAAESLKAAVSSIEGVTDAEDDMPYGDIEIELRLTERGRALGLTETSLASQVRIALSSNDVFSFNQDGSTVNVVVAFAQEDRTRNFLENLNLTTPTGAFVPLSQVVNLDENQGFGTIRREGENRQVTVTAGIDDDSPLSGREIVAIIEDDIKPEIARLFGVDLQLSGSFEDEQEFLSGAVIAGLAALGAIYGVLSLVFGSFLRPLVILLIIPMGFVGMIWGHIIHDIDLTLFSIVGFLGLSGIIINDSIVLVSTIDRRKKTQNAWLAAVDGSVDRLRAVLLTSATTVGGLMPLIFENSAQADFLLPATLTIAYGLGLGTIWVLFLVPCLAAIQSDFGICVRSFLRYVKLLSKPRAGMATGRA